MHFNHPIPAGHARVKKLYRQPVRWTRLFQIYGFFFTLLSFLWHPLPDHGQLPSCSSCWSFISRASPAQLLAVVSPVDLILFGKEFLDFFATRQARGLFWCAGAAELRARHHLSFVRCKYSAQQRGRRILIPSVGESEELFARWKKFQIRWKRCLRDDLVEL